MSAFRSVQLGSPDVQAATKKLFYHGIIWIDTTVLLPLLIEQLEDEERNRKISSIVETCREAGVEFRVTSGVIQEVNAHMNIALTYSRFSPGNWQGRIPYLYTHYLHTGRSPIDFPKWISLFRGMERPDEDLIQYFSDVFSIKREDLTEAAQQVDEELRFAVDRLWSEAHKNRRKKAQQDDEETTYILIQHDVEMYLGVMALRQKEVVNELGYKHWLLTLDSIAWSIRDSLKKELPKKTLRSPLMSLSYLVNNMTFGPSRHLASKASELSLPLILDLEMSESTPYDIVGLANQVRHDNEGLPEYVIRRKVRDAIDKARRNKGCANIEGIYKKEG